MARIPTPIELSEDGERKLELIASRPQSALRDAVRASIVLECARGLSNQEVASGVGVTVQTVCKWRGRYAREGMAGLADAPRSRQPRTISDAKVEEVLSRTLEAAPANRTHWSRRAMAKEAGIGQDSVGRIWRTFGVEPHVVKGFKLSSDPASGRKRRTRSSRRSSSRFLKRINRAGH